MLSYPPHMPNIKSARKAVRSSKKKNAHNLFWKRKIKDAVKEIKRGMESKDSPEMLSKKLQTLQKVLDKSAKEKVIHRNRANRLKSMYASKTAELSEQTSKPKKSAKQSK